MKNELTNALELLGPDAAAQERIWENLMRQAGSHAAEKKIIREKKFGRKLWRTLLLAAALAGAMGVTAYAAGVLGKEALQVTEPEITPQKLVVGEDRKGHEVDNPEEGAIFSITQPQELPEDIDPAIRQKVENSKAAWAEWTAWLEENTPHMPASFEAPDNASKSDLTDNGDGTWKLVFSRLDKSDEILRDWLYEIDELLETDREKAAQMTEEYNQYWEDPTHWIVLEERSVSAEDVERYKAFLAASGSFLEGWDPSYQVRDEQQARKLKEIADRYGLVLRRDRTSLTGTLSDFYEVHGRPDWMSQEDLDRILENDSGLSAERQLSKLSAQCCRGELFRTEPAFVDHLYWYQDGSFGIAFTWRFADGKLADCYLYNSMYATLSSGMELFQMIEDVSAYGSRNYSTSDGAEVTILESFHENAWGRRDSSFVYLYLEDSFVVLQVDQPEGLDADELNEIADSLRYSAIKR